MLTQLGGWRGHTDCPDAARTRYTERNGCNFYLGCRLQPRTVAQVSYLYRELPDFSGEVRTMFSLLGWRRIGSSGLRLEEVRPPRLESHFARVRPWLRKDALNELKAILMKRREAIRKALTGDLSLLKELREQSGGDVVDFAIDSAQDEINSQLAEVESRELAQIEEALGRVKDGTYGKCEGCKNNIPLARLQALPYATTCIDCQREMEKSGATRGTADWSAILGDAGDKDTTMADMEMDFS